MFSGGDSTEVADAGGVKPPVEQAKEAPKEGEAKPAEPGAEAKPAAAEPADPVVADPVVEVQPAMPAVAEAKPEAKAEPAAPGAKPDEMAKTPAAADPAAAKPAEASASPAAEPGKEPAASKPTAEPAKPDATKTETPAKEPAGKQPAAKERAAKEPAAKDAPAKEPAAKEAEKKPPAPPAGKKPFADLKATAAAPGRVRDRSPGAGAGLRSGCRIVLRQTPRRREGPQRLAAPDHEERQGRLGRQGMGDLGSRRGGHRDGRRLAEAQRPIATGLSVGAECQSARVVAVLVQLCLQLDLCGRIESGHVPRTGDGGSAGRGLRANPAARKSGRSRCAPIRKPCGS